ncbi:MAG: septum formation initiator family protein [Romboutsia sp.]
MNLRKRFSGQIVILAVFLMSMIFSMVGGTIFQVSKTKEYKEEIASLNRKLEDTQEEIDKLKSVETYSDKDQLEKIARKKLNMVKPDETVYIVSE